MGNKISDAAGVILLIAFTALVLTGLIVNVRGGERGTAGEEAKRLLTIEMPAGMGVAERAPVAFDHPAHRERAAKEDGCATCHATGENGYLILKVYTPAEGGDKAEYEKEYHDKCIGCPEEKGSGPVDQCGECHLRPGRYTQKKFNPIELDMRQHNKHVEAFDKDCSVCHHKQDPATKELVYIKGAESSCRDCHDRDGSKEIVSLRTAAHEKCVTCHVNESEKGKPAGPTDCAGCHDMPSFTSLLADMSDVPRLDRGQKDMPLIEVADKTFPAVPFNHKAHEQVAVNCRACHHEKLEACDECHTSKPSEEGGGVILTDAYHDSASPRSCVGCHEKVKKQEKCAGCHDTLPAGPAELSCDVCHTGPVDNQLVARPLHNPVARIPDDLPETIMIDSAADQLQPVSFPHLQVVRKLSEIARDDKMSNVFHGDRPVICQSCHHNSPPGDTTPTCAKCHSGPFDALPADRPGLRGAFHLKCIGCHEEMGISDKSDCGECHKDKDSPLPK